MPLSQVFWHRPGDHGGGAAGAGGAWAMLSQTVQSIFDVLWGHGVELGAEKGVGGWHRCAGYPATVAGAQGETHQEEDGLRGSNLKLPAASAADCRCKLLLQVFGKS